MINYPNKRLDFSCLLKTATDCSVLLILSEYKKMFYIENSIFQASSHKILRIKLLIVLNSKKGNVWVFSKYSTVQYELNDSTSVKSTYCDKTTYLFSFWTIITIYIILVIEIIFSFCVCISRLLRDIYERRRLTRIANTTTDSNRVMKSDSGGRDFWSTFLFIGSSFVCFSKF